MKKMIALILALVMALSLVACGNNNTEDDTKDYASMSLEELKAELTTVTEGKLTMSTNATFPPYEMLADDGSFEGIDVEVAGAIAEKLGLELQIDDMSFDAALLAVQGDSPKADIVMAGVTVTEDRQLVMNFSDSYATGIQVVIVKEGSDIKSIDDLEGKKIGTQMGTTGYIYCSDTPENGGYGEENVIAYDSGITAVQALVNGQVDCVVIDNEPAQAYVKANAGLSILDTEFANEDYAIGMNKGNACLLAAVNAAMAELKADGTFQKIVDKYIPAE
ncbi:MAG: transporter substrate-binding domain-containing protein [Clostridiales bacterium]|nr:transporter substrate-binding domain-containing protein [Clostridiales bacterium]